MEKPIPWTEAHQKAIDEIQAIAKRHFDGAVFFCEVDSDSLDGSGDVMSYRGFSFGGYARSLGLLELQRAHIREQYAEED